LIFFRAGHAAARALFFARRARAHAARSVITTRALRVGTLDAARRADVAAFATRSRAW